MKKGKRFDAVKMMRSIRDTLQKEIKEGRLDEKKELKRIHQKYGFSSRGTSLSVAEDSKRYETD